MRPNRRRIQIVGVCGEEPFADAHVGAVAPTSGVAMCSGRNPSPTSQPGMRCSSATRLIRRINLLVELQSHADEAVQTGHRVDSGVERLAALAVAARLPQARRIGRPRSKRVVSSCGPDDADERNLGRGRRQGFGGKFGDKLGNFDPSKVLAGLRIWIGCSRNNSDIKEISGLLSQVLETHGAIVLPRAKPQGAFDDQLVLEQIKSVDHIAMLAVTPGVSVEALELCNISKIDSEIKFGQNVRVYAG